MSAEDIKRKRMEELQAQMNVQQQQAMQEQIKLQQQIEMLETVARQHMTAEAIVRYGNLKTAHPEKAIQVIAVIAQAVQAGQIKAKLTDGQFKDFLRQLQPPKKEFRIVKK